MEKSTITKDQLLKFGMIENAEDEKVLFPLKKVISLPQEDEDEFGEMAICITTMRNQIELCLLLPNSDMLYLSVRTIEELEAFEKCIQSWEPV